MDHLQTTNKLHASESFPNITATALDGQTVGLSKPRIDKLSPDLPAWQMILLYRGQHCPMCTEYLMHLKDYIDDLAAISIDVLAVSADSKEQLEAHLNRTDKHHIAEPNFLFAYGLQQSDLQALGAYISLPRSEKETDHHFAEPALFIVNDEGKLHVVEYSNNPFVRADLATLVRGLKWIRNPENNYPIRGTVN